MSRHSVGGLAVAGLLMSLGCRGAPDTPLAAAAVRGDVVTVQRLAAAGADLDSTASGKGYTALMLAAREGQAESLGTLLRLGANAEVTDRATTEWTALMHAIHKNQVPAVRALLAGGADPDHAVGEHGFTPLMMAAGYGYTDIVETLLAAGADPRKASLGGFTPLVAAVRGTPDIDRFTMGSCQAATVRALLKAAPDLRLPDNSFGKSARWWSWFGTCREVEQLLAGATPQGR